MDQSLTKGSNGSNKLSTTKKPSSTDLVLAQMLNQVSLLYKVTLLPGEVRIWQKSFDGERAEMLEWAFGEYCASGEFPPKPGDITKLIRQRREELRTEGRNQYRPMTEAEYQAAKKDRGSFFATDEYKAFLEKMKAHGL